MVAAADKIIVVVVSSTKIIPGHEPITDKATLKATRDMLATATERMTTMSKKKMAFQQVLAAAPTKDVYDKWGKGIMKLEMLVSAAYSSILRHNSYITCR